MVAGLSDWFLATYVALWGLVLFLVVVVLAVARQVGVLSGRTIGLSPDLPTLKVGDPAVPVNGVSLAGEAQTVTHSSDRRTVLAFVSDGCDFCAKLPEKIEEVAPRFRDTDFWFIAREPPPLDSKLRHPYALERMVIAPDAFNAWGVVGTPFGFVVGTNGKVLAKGDLIGIRRLYDTLDPLPQAGEKEPFHQREEAIVE